MWPALLLPISRMPAEWRLHRAPFDLLPLARRHFIAPQPPPTPLPNPTLIRTAGPAAAAALDVVPPFVLLFAS